MTRVDRQRYADPWRIESHPVDSAQTIDLGEMCYLATDDARPIDQFTYGASLLITQSNLPKTFIGVALNTSESGDTERIAIATEGIFEFNCAAAQFEIGDLVGADDNAGGTALVADQVIAMGENGAHGAIGRVVRRYSANTTRVLVELLPKKNVAPMMIPLYQGLITAAADMVTDWVVTFPFKLNRLHSVVTVLTAGAGTISVHKGATALDDTHVIADASAVGAVDVTVMDDATGDDVFIAGDTLSLVSDGTPTAGEAMFWIEVTPYLREA